MAHDLRGGVDAGHAISDANSSFWVCKLNCVNGRWSFERDPSLELYGEAIESRLPFADGPLSTGRLHLRFIYH